MKIAKEAESEEEVPKALRNRPVLDSIDSYYWKAYQEISGSRQFTANGIGEIRYSEKVCWLDENEVFDLDERRDVLQIVAAIDGAYLTHYYDKMGKP